jgi:hypothetical protein
MDARTRRCFCGAPAKNAFRIDGTWEFFCDLGHGFDRCHEVERGRARTKPDVPAWKVYDALQGKLTPWDLYEVMAQLGAKCDSDNDGPDILAIENASEEEITAWLKDP